MFLVGTETIKCEIDRVFIPGGRAVHLIVGHQRRDAEVAWKVEPDGSVLDATGKVIFFSGERFVKDICLGHCCFICGAQPGSRPFSDEHILPEWLLSHFSLFARTIKLPNEGAVRYDRYTVPCCAACNSLMGEVVEQPISEIIKKGPEALNKYIQDGHTLHVFVWLGLIYLKTHLKDRAHRVHLDKRKGDAKIADEYEWEHLHHIHCIARCFYTDCEVERDAVGSCLSIPVNGQIPSERFDFGDLYLAQTMLLRLGDVALLAVFNDSGGAMSYFWQRLRRITGPVSELQLREMMAELAFLNLHLKERPTFRTECDIAAEKCRIVAERPELALRELDPKIRGVLLHHAIKDALPHLRFPGRTEQDVLDAVNAGTLTFLFDDEGKFIQDKWQRLE